MDNVKFTLKEARDRNDLTQKEAAKKLGISERTLSQYENGVSFPTVKVLKRIEKLYGIEYNDLIFCT